MVDFPVPFEPTTPTTSDRWTAPSPEVSIKSPNFFSNPPQHIDVDFDGTVQLWLDSELGPRWRSGEFHVNVIKALGVDQLLPKRVKKLSGGERQSVSIALCLGRDADLYLLDEPSAHLDANARMEAAKAIRRTMEANEKSALSLTTMCISSTLSLIPCWCLRDKAVLKEKQQALTAYVKA